MTTRADIALHPGNVAVDVARFQALQRAAEKARSDSERVEALLEALALYRGELLPGFYEEWAIAAQRRFSAAFAEMAGEAVPLLEARGETVRALECRCRRRTPGIPGACPLHPVL